MNQAGIEPGTLRLRLWIRNLNRSTEPSTHLKYNSVPCNDFAAKKGEFIQLILQVNVI